MRKSIRYRQSRTLMQSSCIYRICGSNRPHNFPNYKDVYGNVGAVSGLMVPESGTTAERYRKTRCGQRVPDLERCKDGRRRNEEGEDPGNSGGAQCRKPGSA